jgi:hypothetical protein
METGKQERKNLNKDKAKWGYNVRTLVMWGMIDALVSLSRDRPYIPPARTLTRTTLFCKAAYLLISNKFQFTRFRDCPLQTIVLNKEKYARFKVLMATRIYKVFANDQPWQFEKVCQRFTHFSCPYRQGIAIISWLCGTINLKKFGNLHYSLII